jgi:hypothetical protein
VVGVELDLGHHRAQAVVVVAQDPGPRWRAGGGHLAQGGHAAPAAGDVHDPDRGGAHEIGLADPEPGPVQVLERPAPEADLAGVEEQAEGDEAVAELLQTVPFLLEHLDELLHRIDP